MMPAKKLSTVALGIRQRRTSSSRSASDQQQRSVKRLLLVYHSRTGLASQMAAAMERGAVEAARRMTDESSCEGESSAGLELRRLRARDADVDDVLRSDGYLFCCPENLASASGEMLEFFHRTYYHAFDDDDDGESSLLAGRPYGLAIAAGSDGHNAARQVGRICEGWRLRQVAGDAFVNRSDAPQTKKEILSPKICTPEAEERCEELGGLVAATLLL